MTERLTGPVRKEQIVAAALALAEAKGYRNVRGIEVAKEAGCSKTLVFHYFRTMTQLKRAIMRAAIADKCLSVIADGLASGDNYAQKAPENLKKLAVAALI